MQARKPRHRIGRQRQVRLLLVTAAASEPVRSQAPARGAGEGKIMVRMKRREFITLLCGALSVFFVGVVDTDCAHEFR
jgi:hypothetical protein